MKYLITAFLVFTLCSCEKWQKECRELTDIRGEVISECCASGPSKAKKLCRCELEFTLDQAGTMTEKEKKQILKDSCKDL